MHLMASTFLRRPGLLGAVGAFGCVPVQTLRRSATRTVSDAQKRPSWPGPGKPAPRERAPGSGPAGSGRRKGLAAAQPQTEWPDA